MVKAGKIMIACAGVAAFVLFVLPASTAAQVTEVTGDSTQCPKGAENQDCQVNGEETRRQVTDRLEAYQPDPVKYPVPRTKDGKPDFNGVYWPQFIEKKALVSLESLYRPETKAAREEIVAAERAVGVALEDGVFYCEPFTPITSGESLNVSSQVVQGPGVVVYMGGQAGYSRIITTDGSPHDPDAPRSFLGDSRGHWEGDTLVVDITGYNGKIRLGGGSPDLLPQITSKELHIVERWTRPDARMFEREITIEDPEMLTAPWQGPTYRGARVRPSRIFEAVCEDTSKNLLPINDTYFKAHPDEYFRPHSPDAK